MKPIHLQKGKLIDAQDGFVDTFNWLVDCFQNLCGDGDYINVSGKDKSAPMVSFNPPKDEDEEEDDPPEPPEPIDPIDYAALIALIELLSGGGESEVTVQDADGNGVTGSVIQLESGSDSNIHYSISKDNEGVIHVAVDDYYS